MNAAERETVITVSDADDHVHVWTAQRPVITAMLKRSEIVTLRQGYDKAGTAWAEFSIPARLWSPVTGLKRKSSMTAEQKQAAADRLRAMHANRTKTNHQDRTNP